jgi:hypothetical protein
MTFLTEKNMQAETSKTVIKSIRISPSLEERLGIVSRRSKMTESAYLSDALHRQIMLEAITPALDGITVEWKTFRSIVSLADRESIEALGAEFAKRDVLFTLDLLDLPKTKESLLVFLSEIAADCWHWFKIGLTPRGDARILLYHHFGMNWSRFLNSFLVAAFALVSEAPPNIVVTERLLKIDWDESGQGRSTLETPAKTHRDSLASSQN